MLNQILCRNFVWETFATIASATATISATASATANSVPCYLLHFKLDLLLSFVSESLSKSM